MIQKKINLKLLQLIPMLLFIFSLLQTKSEIIKCSGNDKEFINFMSTHSFAQIPGTYVHMFIYSYHL